MAAVGASAGLKIQSSARQPGLGYAPAIILTRSVVGEASRLTAEAREGDGRVIGDEHIAGKAAAPSQQSIVFYARDATTTPILVIDMYEHAYQMDFSAAAAKYIDAFFKNIQWDAVAARLEKSRQSAARLGVGFSSSCHS